MTRITLVSNWTNPETGEVLTGGSTITVEPATARDLRSRGKARPALPDFLLTDTRVAQVPLDPGPVADAAKTEPITEVKPTGSAKPAQAKGRSTNKEVPADG